jgi:OFA family oxalate/formate antiporter-like MFS transporter
LHNRPTANFVERLTMTNVTCTADLAETSTSVTRWKVMIGAILVQLILGTVYGYSIFWEPLQADVFPVVLTRAEHDSAVIAGQDVSGALVVATEALAEAERAVQQSYLKYAFSICILSFAVVMVIAGRIQDLKGPRFTAIIGAVLMGLGFVLAGLMTKSIVFYLAHAAFTGAAGIVLLMLFEAVFGKVDRTEVPLLQHVPLALIGAVIVAGVVLGNQYVGKAGELDKLFLLWGTVGFLAGAGIGFAYVCPIAALIKWFPDHKGLVSGIAVAGFGFGAFLFKGRSIGALSSSSFTERSASSR